MRSERGVFNKSILFDFCIGLRPGNLILILHFLAGQKCIQDSFLLNSRYTSAKRYPGAAKQTEYGGAFLRSISAMRTQVLDGSILLRSLSSSQIVRTEPFGHVLIFILRVLFTILALSKSVEGSVPQISKVGSPIM